MLEKREASFDGVGPVLQAGTLGRAVLAAVLELNQGVSVVERGAYIRVLVPGKCHITRAAVERNAQAEVRFPGDLESVMPSFKGRFSVSENEASWESHLLDVHGA
jgi:hypothetical protein